MLAYHADDELLAWASRKLMCSETNLSRSGFKLQVRKLENRGLIVRQSHYSDSGRQTTNRYQLGGHASEPLPGHITEPLPGHELVTPPGTLAGDPHDIQYEIHNEIQLNGGEPQTEDFVNIDDVMKQHQNLTRNEIFENATRKKGKLTADGCGYLWRRCRSSAGENGFQAELLVKDKKVLHTAYIRVGEEFPDIVWNCMEHWVAFTKHAEKTAGAFNCPLNPNVSFFVKFIEAAADFAPVEDTGFVQLIAKPKKPLTKPIETKDNTDNAVTLAEVLAIGKDLQ